MYGGCALLGSITVVQRDVIFLHVHYTYACVVYSGVIGFPLYMCSNWNISLLWCALIRIFPPLVCCNWNISLLWCVLIRIFPSQSAYYRKWTKPGDREVKAALDGIMKEASHGSRRRFLLTGPPQVTGS